MLSRMITIENLTRKYGTFAALRGMSLQIPDGCVFGLLGPNGAGKSTTVKCLTGILKPSGGRITVDGVDPAADPVEVKRRVGYVPENPVLFKTLTGREVLLLAGRLHKVEEGILHDRISSLLEHFGLMGRADDQIATYSKGMVQKIVIATALIHNPRILVLDEALSGLDAASVAMVKRLLREFAGAGKTVLFCSHMLDVVERLCDRIAIISDGEICASGTVTDILARTGSGTLEKAFMTLTGETDLESQASDVLAALERSESA